MRALYGTVIGTVQQMITDVSAALTRRQHCGSEPAAESADFSDAVWQEVGDDLRQAMSDYPLEQARRDAAGSVAPIVAELLNAGFSPERLASVAGVSQATIRSWSDGADTTDADTEPLRLLADTTEKLSHLMPGISAIGWLHTQLPTSRYTGLDLIAAGHSERLLLHAAGHLSAQTALSGVFDDWRLDDAFEVFAAGDGQPALRPRQPKDRRNDHLADITPAGVLAALHHHGWEVTRTCDGTSARLHQPLRGAGATVVVPLDASSWEFEPLMREALVAIEQAEPDAWARLHPECPADELIARVELAAVQPDMSTATVQALALHASAHPADTATTDAADADAVYALRRRAAALRQRAVSLDAAAASLGFATG